VPEAKIAMNLGILFALLSGTAGGFGLYQLFRPGPASAATRPVPDVSPPSTLPQIGDHVLVDRATLVGLPAVIPAGVRHLVVRADGIVPISRDRPPSTIAISGPIVGYRALPDLPSQAFAFPVGPIRFQASAPFRIVEAPPAPPTIEPRPRPDVRPPPPTGPVRFAGPIPLEPGGRYLASIDVSSPLSLLASADKVRDQAILMGFTDVIVTEDGRPAGWPPGPAADYHVEATYRGFPRSAERSYGGGRVTIVDALRVA
jgi:hypothetical protein